MFCLKNKIEDYLFKLVLITLLVLEEDFGGPELEGPGELSSPVPFAVGLALFFPLPVVVEDIV